MEQTKEKFVYTEEMYHLSWNKFAEAPEDVAKAVVSPDTGDIAYDIAQKHGLADKSPDLSLITGAVMLGLIPIQKFTWALEGHLDISEELARKLATDVRDRIFAPVADGLRKVHGLK